MKALWNGDKDLIKTIEPKAFLALATVLVAGGLFSGGLGSYAGFISFSRLLTDLGYEEAASWLPKLFEGLGYAGLQ